MIGFLKDDIANVEAEVIVNAANAIGYMGGIFGKWFKSSGVAESLHYATKGKIEKEAKKIARKQKPKLGDLYVTSAHTLKAKWVFHAVTMKYPGTWTKIQTVEKCLENILKEVNDKKVKTVALTGLGTGTGGLKLEDIMPLYKKYLENQSVHFILVDPSGRIKEAYEKSTL